MIDIKKFIPELDKVQTIRCLKANPSSSIDGEGHAQGHRLQKDVGSVFGVMLIDKSLAIDFA